MLFPLEIDCDTKYFIWRYIVKALPINPDIKSLLMFW